MSFHGGLVGILIAGGVVARIMRHAVADAVRPGCGRRADRVRSSAGSRTSSTRSCGAGSPTVPWGVVFPGAGPSAATPVAALRGAARGRGALRGDARGWRAREPPPPRGVLLGWLLTLYGVFRIVVEFFREPDVQLGFLAGGVTMGQLLSVPVLVGGIALLVWAYAARAAAARATRRLDSPRLAELGGTVRSRLPAGRVALEAADALAGCELARWGAVRAEEPRELADDVLEVGIVVRVRVRASRSCGAGSRAWSHLPSLPCYAPHGSGNNVRSGTGDVPSGNGRSPVRDAV